MNKKTHSFQTIVNILRDTQTSFTGFIFIIVLGLISSFLSVITTQFISIIIDATSKQQSSSTTFYEKIIHLIANAFNNNSTMFYLILFGVFLITSAVIRNVFCYIVSINSNRMINNMRKKLFSSILNTNYSFIMNKSKGDIIYNIINNTSGIDNVFSIPLYTIISDLFDFFWISVFFYSVGIKYLLLALSVIPIIFIASMYIGKTQKKYHARANKKEKEQVDILDQTHDGYETIKTFNGESGEQDIFNEKSNQWYKSRNLADLFLSLYFPTEKIITTIATIALLLLCVKDIKNGIISFGILPVIIVYISKYYHPVSNISKYYQMIQRGLTSLVMMIDFKKELSKNIFNDRKLSSSNDFDNMIVISGYKLKCNGVRTAKLKDTIIKKGSLTIINGPSGVGKTTLFRAILGLIDNYEGEIHISKYKKRSFDRISYSSQLPFTKNGTVLENIIYPQNIESIKDEEKKKIKELLRNVGFNEDFMYKKINDRGKSLSGGEKQRINLLRALYNKRDILLLDEITANIDKETEETIYKYLVKKKKERTIIVITHSNSRFLYENADLVITLEGE